MYFYGAGGKKNGIHAASIIFNPSNKTKLWIYLLNVCELAENAWSSTCL